VAATYYVDPQSGSDTKAGTSPDTAWQTIPGTRTTDNTAFLRTQWGNIAQSNKVACGDTILLKGGSTYSTTTVSNGGAVRIDPSYYTNTCTASTPVSIKVATSAQWPGSSGPYTVNGAGIVNTSSYYGITGPCEGMGLCGLIVVERLDGIILSGASSTQRIVIPNVLKDPGATAGVLVIGKGAGVGRDVQVGWLDVAGKTAFDSGGAVSISDLGFSWVHDVSIHGWYGSGVNTSFQTSSHRVQSLVIENVTVTNSGNTSTNSWGGGDDFAFEGEFSDARAGGGVWCINCVGQNGYGDGTNSGGCNSVNADGLVRYRDSVFSGNGRNTQVSVGNGIEGSGDSATTCAGGSGNALPEHTIVLIRDVIYNNRLIGLFMPHNAGSLYAWHTTVFRGGEQANVTMDECASSVGIFNSIVDPGSSSAIALGINNCGTVEQNKSTPVVMDTLLRGSSTSTKLSQFKSLCTPDNGVSWTTPCVNGGCPQGQTCRTNFPSSINCDPPCTGQSYGSPPGFAIGNGNIVGTQATNFVSTGGRCDTGFSDGAPGYADCNFHLQSSSPAVDPSKPVYVLLASGSGSNQSTINVRPGAPEPEQMQPIGNYATLKLAWGARPHVGDPRTYFVGPQSHPWATGDIVQIVGTCTNGAARRGAAGRAQIVSMTSHSITVDDTCTWADGAGVHWPWSGGSPDMGAYEIGVDRGGVSAPILLSVDPVSP